MRHATEKPSIVGSAAALRKIAPFDRPLDRHHRRRPVIPLTNRPRLILDTQLILDWMLFRDPSMAALGQAVEAGRVRWLACMGMRRECEHVLTRPALQRWKPDLLAVAERWDRLAEMQPEPPAAPRLRCRDPDDQVFLDLALACRVDALLSRDRDLLSLRRPATQLGLLIARPTDWPGLAVPA